MPRRIASAGLTSFLCEGMVGALSQWRRNASERMVRRLGNDRVRRPSAGNGETYRDVWGNRLYPVCAFEGNQERLNAMYWNAVREREEKGWSEESCDKVGRIECALDSFGKYVRSGIVYATEEERDAIRECLSFADVDMADGDSL